MSNEFTMVPVEPTEEMLTAARSAPLPIVLMDSISARQDLEFESKFKAAIAAAPQQQKEPAVWGAPKTVRQLIGQLETLDPELETVALYRLPDGLGKLSGKVKQGHISTSYERMEGIWLGPYKGNGRKVLAFWTKLDPRELPDGEPLPQPPELIGAPELDGLSFQELRQANVKRLASSKYKLCEQNWQPAHWMNALTGEVGECANIIKKVDRGDYSLEAALPNIARELADIQCYLDILAFKLGIDLGAATVSKFDEVSERIGSPIRLGEPVKEPAVCAACNGKREIFCHDIEDGWYEPCNTCSPAGSEMPSCNNEREDLGVQLNTPCKACGRGPCIDR